MWILSVLLGIACVLLLFFLVRLCLSVKNICSQLEEIERGSHIEITLDSRQRVLLALCKRLNSLLAVKDKNYMQYARAEKLLKQNITGLAHDIRTPLTGAFGYVQLAQECTEEEKRERYLSSAACRLSELENMLEEMFLYTKLTNEEFTLSIKNIQALPLLGSCLLGLYTRFEELNVAPKVEFEDEGFSVMADEEALRRVFLNIIQNALSHGLGGLCVFQRGRSIFFENPIPADSRLNPQLIFDRFYKADAARGKGSSGLGLFIVKELMERMQGSVRAEREEGLFRLELFFEKLICEEDRR